MTADSSTHYGSQYMTWMQASPLAFVEQGTKRPSRLDELDLELERSAMRETFQHFPLDFSIATPNKLGNYFSRRISNRSLHISCHGTSNYLILEDGYGTVLPLTPNVLTDWIQKSLSSCCCPSTNPNNNTNNNTSNENNDNSFQFVFVAACGSRSIGEALVQAGVKHVICCSENSIMDLTSSY